MTALVWSGVYPIVSDEPPLVECGTCISVATGKPCGDVMGADGQRADCPDCAQGMVIAPVGTTIILTQPGVTRVLDVDGGSHGPLPAAVYGVAKLEAALPPIPPPLNAADEVEEEGYWHVTLSSVRWLDPVLTEWFDPTCSFDDGIELGGIVYAPSLPAGWSVASATLIEAVGS